MLTLMRPLILFLLLTWTCPLVAQPVTIKFVVQSELSTELTSLTDIHVMTTHGPYNYHDISSMSFLSVAPDSTIIVQLRTKGIGVFLKTKYLKPISAEAVVPAKIVEPERVEDATIEVTRTVKDSIWMKDNSFWQGSLKIRPKNALDALERNPASHNEAAMARSNYNMSQLVGFVGGFMIGWPLGQAIGGKQEPQWGLAAGGAALLIVGGIPLSVGFKKHVQKAMTIYNGKIMAPGSSGLSFRFYPGVNGGTLIVRF